MNSLLDSNFLSSNLEQLPYHEIANWITLCRKKLAERCNPNLAFFRAAKAKLEEEQNKRISFSFFRKKQR
ncbi:MAG: hypothetical protein AAF770_01610 [Bacteroidota bacterium]